MRSRPKRAMIMVFGGVAGLAWSTLFAVFITVWRQDSARVRATTDILGPFAADVKRLFGPRKPG